MKRIVVIGDGGDFDLECIVLSSLYQSQIGTRIIVDPFTTGAVKGTGDVSKHQVIVKNMIGKMFQMEEHCANSDGSAYFPKYFKHAVPPPKNNSKHKINRKYNESKL